jgi:hypothetical protein
MGTFIYFTDEQKLRANEVDLAEFLRRQGEKLIHSGRDKRLASDHSVTVRGNEWYDHAAEKGGHAIDFVQRHYGLSFPAAVTLLLGGEQGVPYDRADSKKEPEAKPFELPAQNKDMRRVFGYLIKHRCIDRDVITHFARAGTLYEDAEYHNAVFAGTDEHGVFRHAHKRSANSVGKAFRQNVEGSDPRCSFHHIGTSDRLYVFEAPIDMLSFISLYPSGWQEHSYVSLCGVGGQTMMWMLEQNPNLQKVCLCLDNDEAGLKAVDRLSAELNATGYEAAAFLPTHKDWNDELTARQMSADTVEMAASQSQSMT